LSIQVEPDPAHPAGHALIRVLGAAAAAGTPGFRVQRDAGWGDDKLGPGGWQSSDALLLPNRAEAQGPDLLLHVGWDVCRHLEAGVYEISVPGAGLAQVGAYWPDIVPLHSGGQPVVVPRAAAEAATQPPDPVPPPVPEPPPAVRRTVSVGPASDDAVTPPLPSPAPAASGVSKVVLLTAGVLGLLAGGGAYWWVNRAPVPTDAAQVAPTAPAPSPAAPAPANFGALSVPDVLAQAPNPAAITVEGERRLRGDRHDDGLLLLEAAADRADPAAAAALARLYDPVQFRPGGPIPQPDARQAARYYRDAARGGADVTAAREALRQSLQTRVQAGDLGATLSLKDFWP
jgi:hypothetical protein